MASKERIAMFNLKSSFLKGATLLATVCMVGCSDVQIEYGFALDSDHIIHRMGDAKEDALKREEFYIDLASVVDRRRGEDRYVRPTGAGKIYEYDPNSFLQGLETYVKNAYEGKLSRISRGTKRLVVDLEIEKFKMQISKGSFFTGPYGRYEVDMTYTMIVRDHNSDVIFTDTIEYHEDQKRDAYRGHHPSSKQDEAVMKKMVRDAVQKTAVDMGWLIHRAFNDQRKYYRPEAFDKEFTDTTDEKKFLPAS